MKYKAFLSYKHSENGRRHAVALETALKGSAIRQRRMNINNSG